MLGKFTSFLKKDSKGTTAIEYALIASLIAVVAITGMKMIGNKISEKFNQISDIISDPNSVDTSSGTASGS